MWTLRRWFFTRRSACRDIPELAASEMMAMFWLKEQMSERYTPDTKVQLAAVVSQLQATALNPVGSILQQAYSSTV